MKFTTGTKEHLMERKSVRITYVNGQSITKIEPVNCSLSDKEKEVIERSNFVMDYYIFPDREVGVGSDWPVPGEVLGGFLDPRLSGKAGGSVTVMRTPDFVSADGAVSKRAKITSGNLIVQDTDGGKEVTGKVTGITGTLAIPDLIGVVTNAHLQGYADYQNVSTDHLLFQAKMAVKPKFEIQYNCSVQ